MFDLWWKGVVVFFVLRGMYVAVDRHTYDDFASVVLMSVLWPASIVQFIYDFYKQHTLRPWYMMVRSLFLLEVLGLAIAAVH